MAFPTSPTAGQIYQAASGKRYEYMASGGWSEIHPVLTGTITYAVPGDFATAAAAMDYLRNFVLGDTCSITINVAAGTYTSALTINGHPQGNKILIKGANKPTLSAANFANTGNSLAQRTADKATNKTMLQGKYSTEIVSTGSYAVLADYDETIKLENILFQGADSGVFATGTVIATDCSAWGGTGYGFGAGGTGVLRLDGSIGASGSDTAGFGANNGALIVAPTADLYAYGCGHGLFIRDRSMCDAGTINVGGNENYGIQAARNSEVYATSIISAKDDIGLSARYGGIIVSDIMFVTLATSQCFNAINQGFITAETNCSASSNGADYAVRADAQSAIRLVSLALTGAFNINNVLSNLGSYIHIDNASLSAGAATSMRALSGSHISSNGVTSNVTRSPALNTVGNDNSYIEG